MIKREIICEWMLQNESLNERLEEIENTFNVNSITGT